MVEQSGHHRMGLQKHGDKGVQVVCSGGDSLKSEGDPEWGEEEVRGRGRQNWREGERKGEEERPRTGVVAQQAYKR